MEQQIETLETEKEDFLVALCNFVDSLNIEYQSVNGNSPTQPREIIKQLLIMGYNGMSYRRAISDLKVLKERDYFSKILPRSTLNDYANKDETIKILERLIQLSALFFKDSEDTLIVDSTWFSTRMYVGGHKKVHDKKNTCFDETRKIHVGCLKNSRVICFAKTTAGTVNDSPVFEEIVKSSSKLFDLDSVLGDKGYCSKNNYFICSELGIKNVFIDFKKNTITKRAKSQLWRDRVDVWKNNPEVWYEDYRFRVIIENLFSSIKRKHSNYLRSRNLNAQDVELLLKCLVHNLTTIGKEMKLGHLSDKNSTSD